MQSNLRYIYFTDPPELNSSLDLGNRLVYFFVLGVLTTVGIDKGQSQLTSYCP